MKTYRNKHKDPADIAAQRKKIGEFSNNTADNYSQKKRTPKTSEKREHFNFGEHENIIFGKETSISYVFGSMLWQISNGKNIGKNLFFIMLFSAVFAPLSTVEGKQFESHQNLFDSDRTSSESKTEDEEPYEKTSLGISLGGNKYGYFGSNNDLLADQRPHTFRQHLNAKTIIDPNITGNLEALYEKCEVLKDKITHTVQDLPHSEKHIIPSLCQEEFKVICTDDMSLQGKGAGGFSPEDNSIMINVNRIEEIDTSLINHEFIHSFNFFLHQKSTCKTEHNFDESLAPVYPVTIKNIKNYHKAFDKGDKRISEFANLWKRKLQGIKLNEAENRRLEKYTQASKNCMLSSWKSNISKENYDRFIKSGWEDGKINSFKFETQYGPMEIVRITKIRIDNGNYLYKQEIKPLDPVQTVLVTPEKVQRTLNSPVYKDQSDAIKIAERETYTFEDLSEEAIEFFYKEANTLRKAYISQCADESEQHDYLGANEW